MVPYCPSNVRLAVFFSVVPNYNLEWCFWAPCEMHSVVALGTPGINLMACSPQLPQWWFSNKGRARAGAAPPSKADTPWASGIIGLLHASCLCTWSSFGWCVSRGSISPWGEKLRSLGQNASTWLDLWSCLCLEKNNFKALSCQLAHFTLVIICLFFDICMAFIFAFLLPSRRRPLLELHLELNDSVYDWNTRVSLKERYYVGLQHTLRKKLILSCKWKTKGPF